LKILVTGGCGFIGSNFIELVLRSHPHYEIVCLDALTYAGNLENLANVELDGELSKRFRLVKGSISSREDVVRAMKSLGKPDAVINFAAESHVDRSLDGALPFVRTNVEGTLVLLEESRRAGVGRFLQVSTDEVYGSLGPGGTFREESPLHPNNPYSVTKAAADMMVMAFAHTYGMNVVITRSSNNYGPRQYPEKLIPLLILNAIEELPIPVYGDGLQIRDWLHVFDNCRGILAALELGRPGQIYNLGGGNEVENLNVVRMVLARLRRPDSLIRHVPDRPGHDRRYAVDCSKSTRDLGWRPTIKFSDGLGETVDWYLANKQWVARVKSGEYRDYYRSRYGGDA
jgi:dTDP-glucose 4,6-dehydratase